MYTRNGYDIEFRQSKAIAGAFVAAGGEYLIYSSVPSPAVISDGRYKNVFLFEVKADVQKYISKLPIKSAFFVPGSLMQNYQTMMVPKPAGDGTFAIFDIVSPDMLWPLIDVRSDTGKFVAAILADPTAYVGKELSAATKLYSWSGITESLSKATGQTVRYVQMPVEQWRSFMPPDVADSLVEMRKYMDEFGYYGADTRAKVQWSAEQARGNLTTLDEYLQQNPISLKGPS